MEVHSLHFETLDSTNDFAKLRADEFDPKQITCITADEQTKGHGRFKRAWVSKKGNLHMTLVLHIPADSPLLPNLAQLLALAAARMLLARRVRVQIKWPNDLVAERKKLAGVLVETTSTKTGLAAVLGIGMNVNAPVESEERATSLLEITGETWDLRSIQNEIVANFQQVLTQGFCKDAFEPLLAYLGENIRVETSNQTLEGILAGITEAGHLQLKTDDETITEIRTGEIQQLRCK